MVTRNAKDHIPIFKNDDDTVLFTGLVENRGSSGTPIVLTEGTPCFSMYATNSGSSGGTSAEPFYIKCTLTNAGQVGGRSRFHTVINAAAGGWSNALKGLVEYGTSGRTVGIGSAIVGELVLSTGTTNGTYAPIESELVANSAVSTGTSTSFMFMDIAGSDGTGKTTINANGYLFEIGDGIVANGGNLFDSTADTTAAQIDHSLKVKIDGSTYYVPLMDNANGS